MRATFTIILFVWLTAIFIFMVSQLFPLTDANESEGWPFALFIFFIFVGTLCLKLRAWGKDK
jgi:hypothetical protein